MADSPPSGVVALDNSGTLSLTASVSRSLRPTPPELGRPVPEIPPDRARVALLSLDCDRLDAFTDGARLAGVVADNELSTHLALSNAAVTPAEARAALLADETADAAPVREVAREALADDDADAAGVQVVVDVDAREVVRAVGYTATPRPEAAAVVRELRAQGFEPHLVSGDTPGVLAGVADAVGVDAEHVHPLQSPADKAETVGSLGADPEVTVAMVGDYVNDRLAFEAAHLAVFVDDAGVERAREVLGPRADATVPTLSAVPDAIAERVGRLK